MPLGMFESKISGEKKRHREAFQESTIQDPFISQHFLLVIKIVGCMELLKISCSEMYNVHCIKCPLSKSVKVL